MTIKELIEKLREMDESLEVMYLVREGDEDGYSEYTVEVSLASVEDDVCLLES